MIKIIFINYKNEEYKKYNKEGYFMIKEAQKPITGILSKHRKGYGFVIPENKEETEGKDIFISPNDMGIAMDNDLVVVHIYSSDYHGRNLEGKIEKILSRGITEMVGTFFKKGGHGVLIPENNKMGEELWIQKKDYNGAHSGDKVVAKITHWPKVGRQAEGKIIEIISQRNEPGGDVKALVRSFQIKEEFPKNVLSEAERINQIVEEKDLIGRRDLREKNIFTMDGADAKDLDDAISVELLDNGNFYLGVHIADVSHYVKEGKALDKEALSRGTSIYLIDRVIPMLPKALSNGICSLIPHEDRLALSISIEIDKEGKVISHEIYESVIRSKERLVYTDISDLLENHDTSIMERYKEILPDLMLMDKLATILSGKRQKRGSLDFDFDEPYIVLNEEGIPISVEIAERRVANRIIEEFMILANEIIAEHFYHMQLPFIYRIHEKPSSDKMAEFKRFLLSLGLRLKGNIDNIHPKSLNDILVQVIDTEVEHVVNSVMLRSLKKAFYGTICLGHFGLGIQYYCHFTAPIRRYSDLMIHRIIKETLHGTIFGKRLDILKKKTEEASTISSATERKAEELEREVEKLKKAQYMSYHLGEEYEGIISGITSFGFFVEIENTVEGLVRLDTINDDHYIYEMNQYRFIGQRYHKVYSLGQKVRITVTSVDILNREIQFELSN
ncbi:MAG: ribonuclease R [Anaerovoracaceae bacterium]|jgi:ribonuclease R